MGSVRLYKLGSVPADWGTDPTTRRHGGRHWFEEAGDAIRVRWLKLSLAEEASETEELIWKKRAAETANKVDEERATEDGAEAKALDVAPRSRRALGPRRSARALKITRGSA